MKIRSATIAAIAALAAGGIPAPAPAVPTPLVVATYLQFMPGQTGGPVEVVEGTPLMLTHLDAIATQFYTPWHDLTSFALDDAGDPLFSSDLLGFGETGPVTWVESLPPGTYGFYCASHGETLMSGELVVLPSP